MTRQAKCDYCRKSKIKCDERLPSCGLCIRRGKECTRSRLPTLARPKNFRFVEVTARVVQGEATSEGMHNSTVSRDRTVITTHRTRPDDHQVSEEPPWHQMSLRREPQSSALSMADRWIDCVIKQWGGVSPLDSLSSWSHLIPHYSSRSVVVAKATSCLIDISNAQLRRSEESFRAATAKYVDCIKTLNATLDSSRGQYDGETLVAILELYWIDVMIPSGTLSYIRHAHGLVSLFKQYSNRQHHSEEDRELIATIFPVAASLGFTTSAFAGTDHLLDDADWAGPLQLSALTERQISYAASCDVSGAISRIVVAIPRLIRLVREFRSRPNDAALKGDALQLAVRLYADSLEEALMSEAVGTWGVKITPTTHQLVRDVVPMSYVFPSITEASTLCHIWATRILICGLVMSLCEVLPVSESPFDEVAVQHQEIRVATNIVMCSEWSITRGDELFDGEEMRMLFPYQVAFGAWHRLLQRESRGGQSPERAMVMKSWCLDRGNAIQHRWLRTHSNAEELEYVAAFFSGKIMIQVEV